MSEKILREALEKYASHSFCCDKGATAKEALAAYKAAAGSGERLNEDCCHVDTLGRNKCDRCGLPLEMWAISSPAKSCRHERGVDFKSWVSWKGETKSKEDYPVCPFCPAKAEEAMPPAPVADEEAAVNLCKAFWATAACEKEAENDIKRVLAFAASVRQRETERCAKIADYFKKHSGVARNIAAAIRKGGAE